MSLRRLLPVGLLLLLAPLFAQASTPLYDRIKWTIEEVVLQKKIDPTLAPFIKNILFVKDTIDIDVEILEKIVKAQSEGEAQNACAEIGDETLIDCVFLIPRIKEIAEQELRIRKLGNSLQGIATSYELPLSDLPSRTLKLSADLRGILNIWIAGTGSVKSTITTPLIRTTEVDPDRFEQLLTDIGTELKDLSEEERTAAVWRYQYGVRLVKGERAPRFPAPYALGPSGPGTERQYLFKHWTDLEEKLKAIWDEIVPDTFDPPLTQGETVYYDFPLDLMDETLTGSIILWARLDGDSAGRYPFGDVGLQWETPLDPVMPSLIDEDTQEDAILGGTYPPEPAVPYDDDIVLIDGQGLCTGPVHMRGYLCRPYEILSPEERCPVVPGAEPDQIQLVSCTNPTEGPQGVFCCNRSSNQCSPTATSTECVQQGGSPSATAQGCRANGCNVPVEAPVYCCLRNQNNMCAQTLNSSLCVQQGGSPSATEDGCVQNGCDPPAPEKQRFTQAGADVCREIGWKEPTPFDPNTQCKLAMRCANDCNNGPNIGNAELKNSSGVIEVCMENGAAGISYILYHELIHAYQFCAMPIDADQNLYSDDLTHEEASALCCEVEGEAYQAGCELMERDGVFDGASYQGIPIDAETCKESGTDSGCRAFQNHGKALKGCFTSRTYPQNFFGEVIKAMQKNPKNLPTQCADAIDPKKMDPRVADLMEAVQRRDDVCRPGEINIYKNRIGNNACYIGQCVEQSVELHRVAAGNIPTTVQDAIAPWDDPLTGSPLGNILMNPPLSQARLPEYRPQALMRTLENALCQLQGLPPRTPPVLCAIEASRQLGYARTTGVSTAVGLQRQEGEGEMSADDLLDLARGIGTRAGTQMYARYMQESNRSFADILTMAASLLKELDKINFPTEMCPATGLPPPRSSAAPTT